MPLAVGVLNNLMGALEALIHTSTNRIPWAAEGQQPQTKNKNRNRNKNYIFPFSAHWSNFFYFYYFFFLSSKFSFLYVCKFNLFVVLIGFFFYNKNLRFDIFFIFYLFFKWRSDMATETKLLAFEEVSKHNQKNDCWLIISGKVNSLFFFEFIIKMINIFNSRLWILMFYFIFKNLAIAIY